MTSHEQVVRDSMAAFDRGDLDAALAAFDPYAVVRFDPKWPESRPRLGIEEIRGYFQDLIATFGSNGGELQELIDAGDRLVVRNLYRFQGHGSGIQDHVEVTQVLTFRGGKVIECEYFLDFDEALKAVGLSK